MKIFLFLLAILISSPSFAQTAPTISVMDFVKVKNDKWPEVLYYYENNWKLYRDIALKRNFIVSYRLLKAKPDSVSTFDLVLITEYADSLQFKMAEERFQIIIKEMRPTGPILLNNFKANDFRQNMFVRETQTLFSSDKK